MAKQLDALSVYDLGIWLGYIEGILTAEKPVWGDVREALHNLSTYKLVEGLEFIGSESQSEFLRLARIYKYSKKKLFAENDKSSLTSLGYHWRGRLTEVQKRWVMSSPKVHLDISKLCTGAHAFFEVNEWSALNKLEKEGLKEAAACLLTNNFTASEFMAVRTVESVLRRWYELKTGKVTERQSLIFDIIEDMYPENKRRPKEIQQVFYFKHRRNAIAHPDMISNSEDASVTFTHSVETCSYMVNLTGST
ncbi:MAG: hypothetical protein PHQ86_06075 [Dehalococcoidales bacterium]|nr:hypothetical protein [Dehalococcoidales bacterium]